ncbi:hypothetical protein AMTRI_Chr02g262140 [Amborella trichopoda]
MADRYCSSLFSYCICFLVVGHIYITNFGIGHSMKDLLEAHTPPPGGRLGQAHKDLYDTINNSIHSQLGLALASLGVITSLVAQYMYFLPPYAFIAQDFTTQATAIFFIRDYNPEQNEDNVLARMLDHKEAIKSHLSWASLFLGFHTLGLLCLGDFLIHHAIALGLHTTTLILVKGALNACGSKFMPDKKDFRGTCDISAWDAFYLAVFWMLNTIGCGKPSQFNESSTYLMGSLRNYLWLNSLQLINGYNPFGANSLSIWALMFLFGHLVWATGFMDKPVALSIVQARLVGLAHLSVGYIFTYAAFLIASTSGKFG